MSLDDAKLKEAMTRLFEGFSEAGVPAGTRLYKGKVRDVFDLGDEMVISVSDRISAFDRVLGAIPFKGEVLNKTALFWFEQTADIIPNHIRKVLGPRTVAVQKCDVLPVEVIVRGYLTGSAWRDYQAGRPVSGIELPGGMTMNQAFGQPLLTPSTKADQGDHDKPISGEEIVAQGLVGADLWKEVEQAALALFQRGTEIAARNGLILVDTKYEFGLSPEGNLVLVDEIHTPDSSRYWFADTYEELFKKEEAQRKVDKEYLRQWLMSKGFSGDGDPPEIPEEVRLEVARRYIQAYELITGEEFRGESDHGEAEAKKVLSYIASGH